MKMTFTFLLLLLLASPVNLRAQGVNPGSDDRSKMATLFALAVDNGGQVTIPPGDYHLDGSEPIPLRSETTVTAYGARFHLPAKLDDQARAVLFSGENVKHLRWFGGHFKGRVFDPDRTDNSWEPNANTRGILITTTSGGDTANLTFRDMTSDGMAGAVITVLGAEKQGSDREIDTYARNVTIENCTLERSGKFMWDYGFLWQRMVWPEDYNNAERTLATKYFPPEFIHGPVQMKQGDDRVLFNNTPPLPVSKRDYRGQQSLCFYHDDLPSNVVRGRQYFIVESKPDFIRIAETLGGEPIRFASDAGADTRLMYPLFHAHLALYAPKGSGPGKGALDLVGCEDVIVRGCRLSALGDTMHIQKSRDILFTGNHITGSRMGAFFLAEYCQNAVITGNTVDGTNGSRVISVEKSCEDVAIVGNTFRNGGRGSWINQPKNFVLADNVFVNNTTKCEPDPQRGRRSFLTGDYEEYAELYFTTHEPGGRYGNVSVRGNIFISGDHASYAITFAPGGDTLLVSDNIFQGKVQTIATAPDCTNVTIRRNVGADQPNASKSP